MMKQDYLKPTTLVVELRHKTCLLLNNSVQTVSTNLSDGDADLNYQGGGSGPARARSHGVWDDDWDEE